MRASRLLSCRAWAAALVGLLGTLLALCLASQSERVSIRAPLAARPARGPLVAAPLPARAGPGATVTHELELASERTTEILAHDEVWLFLAPAAGGSRLVTAALRDRATLCRFEATAAARLVEGEPLTLRRVPGCAPRAVASTERGLVLTVETGGGEPLGIWAHRPRPGSPERGQLLVASPAPGEPPLSVRGFLVDYPPTAPRIELLNAMWRLSASVHWLWLSAGAGIALALAGCLVFPTSQAPEPPSIGFGAAAVAGAALLAASLGVLYAVLTPPLSGPDEPYHLLGFADMVGDAPLAEQAVAWIGQTHLLRIRHQPSERFRSVDPGVPYVADDPELRPTEVAMRSATLATLWRAASPALVGRGAPRALLVIRLLNVLLFALAVGTATALAVACAQVRFPQWTGLAFFVVPSLPFFAMHVSETALLCSTYVLLAMSLAVLFQDGPRAHWAGLPLGLASGLMLAGGRSPWPLAAVVAAAVLTRLALGTSQPGKQLRTAVVFWLGLALGNAVFYLLQNDEYTRMVMVCARFVPGALRPLADKLVASPLPIVFLLAAAAALEAALAPLRPRIGARLSPGVTRLARWVALALTAFVVLSLAGSLVLHYPQLELEPRHRLSAGERVGDVLATMATLFRLREPNFLLSTSFWVGFGWLDTIPGPGFQALLVLLTAVAVVGLLLALARRPEPRRFAWLAALGLGGVASLVLYTLVTQDLPMALQGRYLIGWYLVFLTIACTWLAESRVVRGLWLLALAGGIHVYCLCFMLRRYF